MISKAVYIIAFELLMGDLCIQSEINYAGKFETFIIILFTVAADKIFSSYRKRIINIQCQAISKQGVVTLQVNGVTLHVHHIIIFQQALTYSEVVFFYLSLRPLDRFSDHAVLDHFTFLISKLIH